MQQQTFYATEILKQTSKLKIDLHIDLKRGRLKSQSRSLCIRIPGGDFFQIFNSQEGKFTFESAPFF